MTIYGFQILLWRQFRGVGLCPYMTYGRVYPYLGKPQRRGFLGGLKCVSPYYLQLTKSMLSKTKIYIYASVLLLGEIGIFLYLYGFFHVRSFLFWE
jgi:hypothetical protein